MVCPSIFSNQLLARLEYLGHLIAPKGSKQLLEKIKAVLSYKLLETTYLQS